MKFTTAISTVLLTVSSTVKAANAKSDTLNVIPNFLPPTAFVSSSTDLFKDTASSTAKARQRGMDALITTEKTLEIKEIMGVLPATSNENGNFLITSKISKTTRRHTDKYRGTNGVTYPIGEASTGFIILNDNPHAHFDYEETSVPIKKGSLVVFKGGRPHNTVVRSGSVDLLGPFEGSWFSEVGGRGDDDDDDDTSSSSSSKSGKGSKGTVYEFGLIEPGDIL